jgi:hypothetical protein
MISMQLAHLCTAFLYLGQGLLDFFTSSALASSSLFLFRPT